MGCDSRGLILPGRWARIRIGQPRNLKDQIAKKENKKSKISQVTLFRSVSSQDFGTSFFLLGNYLIYESFSLVVHRAGTNCLRIADN